MAIGYGIAVPKGKTRKQLRARAKRQDAKALKAFQDAVWLRESTFSNGGNISPEVARCQKCGAPVVRIADHPRFGQVHHIVSRRRKATRTDPKNGRLLCRECHNTAHGREF